MAEMTQKKFDELVEYVTREHGNTGAETYLCDEEEVEDLISRFLGGITDPDDYRIAGITPFFRDEEGVKYLISRFVGGITDPDDYGTAGIADLIALAYWDTREKDPDRANAAVEFLIDCSRAKWEPGKGNVPPGVAWDAVWQIAYEHLRRLGQPQEPISPRLVKWTRRRFLGRNRAPKAQKAGPRMYARDAMICEAIRDLCDRFRLKPTRNDEPAGEKCCAEGGSACDVVGAVVAGLSFKNTRRIWNERDPDDLPPLF